jgi:hypothetical protein
VILGDQDDWLVRAHPPLRTPLVLYPVRCGRATPIRRRACFS